jgi:hypothetical protein
MSRRILGLRIRRTRRSCLDEDRLSFVYQEKQIHA